MLSEEQDAIRQAVIDELSLHKIILINGSAGTGKTYLAAAIINDFTYAGHEVLITAPTHQALNVLKEKLKVDEATLDDNSLNWKTEMRKTFETVHSALQMKRIINKYTGEVTFRKDLYAKYEKGIYKGKYYVMIVDEASMLEKGILDILEKLDNVYLLFLGDIKQINPVVEPISEVFTRGYKTFTLLTYKRQNADNPIIDISLNPNKLALKQKSLVGNQGYLFNNNIETLTDRIAKSPDNIVYLAWTNDAVNLVNKKVREKIYKTPNRYELGEYVIFDRPYGEYYNRQKVKIRSLKTEERTLSVPNERSYVDKKGKLCNAVRIDLKCYIINNSIIVLHESDVMTFFDLSVEIKQMCEHAGFDWKLYYGFIEQVASLKYSYAMTVHVSQGSTFFATIVDVGNIYKNPDRGEAKRLLYTAITRSSNVTIFYNT